MQDKQKNNHGKLRVPSPFFLFGQQEMDMGCILPIRRKTNLNMDTISILISTVGGWLFLQLLIILLIFLRGKKVKISQGKNSIEADLGTLSPGNYRIISSGCLTPISYLVSQIGIITALFLLSPQISSFVCEFSTDEINTTLNVELTSTTGKNIQNLVLEVNGDATHPLTDQSGKTKINLSIVCSKMMGCKCEETQTLNFVVFDNNEIVFRKDDVLSTAWLKQNNSAQYEINID